MYVSLGCAEVCAAAAGERWDGALGRRGGSGPGPSPQRGRHGPVTVRGHRRRASPAPAARWAKGQGCRSPGHIPASSVLLKEIGRHKLFSCVI